MNINTMVFALALGNFTLCAALFFFDYERKKSLALSTWAIARQCQAVAWLLLYVGGSGVIPELISVPLGYSVLIAGVALEAGSLWEAAEHFRWRRVMLPLMAVAVAVFLGCYLVDELGLRVVAGSLILGGFYLSGAVALGLGWRQASMLRRFLVLAMALLALVVAMRGVLVLTMPAGWGWISNAMVQLLSSAAFYLLMLLGGFGYLLLSRERLQGEVERLALVDPLTDVPNRRGFSNALAPWMALARRPGMPTSLIMLEFDQFKRINDSYGHPAGDVVLRSIVEVCKKQLRDSDLLGRLVSVEFAVLLPRTNLAEAMLVAERMRAAIEASRVKSERALIGVTASMGVTTLRPEDSSVSLFQRVDAALQSAKLAGRNQVAEALLPDLAEA